MDDASTLITAIAVHISMNELDYALETVDEGTFENLAAAFLRSRGYRTREIGVTDRLEGWNARVAMRVRSGIAHASIAEDWRAQLRADAETLKRMEEERGERYHLFVFVTNQDVTGQQEFDMEDEIAEEYGWRLRLYHRQDLLGEIYNHVPGLAKHHLDVNLGFDTDHRANLEELLAERLNAIQERREEATELEPGPAVAVHVVPNGIFSTRKTRSTADVPDPSVLAGPDSTAVDARGKLKVAYDYEDADGTLGCRGYALLRNDGLYESSTRRLFYESERGDLLLRSCAEGEDPGLDAAVVVAMRNALAHLSRMGYSATASVWVSVLDAAGAKLDCGRVEQSAASSPALGVDRYSTEVVTASIDDREHEGVVKDLEPALSELWREFGYPAGTYNVEDGEWIGDRAVDELPFP